MRSWFKKSQQGELPRADASLPAALVKELEAEAANLSQELPGWQALASADFDDERGSLRLLLANGYVLRLATDDAKTAEHICAMSALGPTKVAFSSAGPRTVVLASSEDWSYTLAGFPALAANA